jgi:hypothetical protein
MERVILETEKVGFAGAVCATETWNLPFGNIWKGLCNLTFEAC